MEKKGSALLRRSMIPSAWSTRITVSVAVYLRQGALSQAIALLARGLALCQSWDIQSWLHSVAANLGRAYALSGRVAEALPLLEQAASMGRRGGHAMCTARLSEAYLLAGQIDKGQHPRRAGARTCP